MPGTLESLKGRARQTVLDSGLFRIRHRLAALSRRSSVGQPPQAIMRVVGRLESGVTKEYLADIKTTTRFVTKAMKPNTLAEDVAPSEFSG
jgi:hypothetical protein